MSAPNFPYFNSKILLFGEYSLMFGSMALSMPTNKYGGRLSFDGSRELKGEIGDSNNALSVFAKALKKLKEQNALGFNINTDKLFEDISNALFFDSNIPMGYGLGSSGALVAAIYTEYAEGMKDRSEIFDQDEITALKMAFSKMESFFHGKSSGLDPLICFLQKPILVENDKLSSLVTIPESKQSGKAGVFLLDSGASGETEPLVNTFIDNCKDEKYFKTIRNELIPLNNKCISSFLADDVSNLLENLKELSRFTLKHLFPMVPPSVVDVWKQGLDTEDYFLKLCGSGGGGMLLGFTNNLEKAKASIRGFDIELIHVF